MSVRSISSCTVTIRALFIDRSHLHRRTIRVRRITPSSAAQEAERTIRCAIIAVLVAGFRRRNWGAVVNAALAVIGTSFPDVVEHRYDVEFLPWQRVYIATAMVMHAVGMLGPYDDTRWWDHLTHAYSATLFGGVVHVVTRRRDRDPRPRVLAAVGFVGVLWELMEYAIHVAADRLGLEPVLVPYGKKDTALDLCFDVLGALFVLAVGDRFLWNFIRRSE